MVALTQAAVSGVSTYAIAQVAKTYMANGVTWGTDSPKAVVASILSNFDEDSIMRWELIFAGLVVSVISQL